MIIKSNATGGISRLAGVEIIDKEGKKSATISPRYLNGFKVGDQTIQIDLTDEQTLLQTYIRFKTAKNSWLNYGFEWSEASHMIKEWDHFSEWLVENYDGAEQEIAEELLEQDPDDQIEAIEDAMKENEEVIHTVGAYVVFSLMGLEPEKVSYIVRHPDEFIEWVRGNYEFPEDMGFMM